MEEYEKEKKEKEDLESILKDLEIKIKGLEKEKEIKKKIKKKLKKSWKKLKMK